MLEKDPVVHQNIKYTLDKSTSACLFICEDSAQTLRFFKPITVMMLLQDI